MASVDTIERQDSERGLDPEYAGLVPGMLVLGVGIGLFYVLARARARLGLSRAGAEQ